ncbi:hypothetical protein E2C01_037049 [Portunus trituberculatus]|uniref:Uncharacterized protein n=1 Tax=Portunus trituberculatus TaxID=210409 RepID=A0A5B7FEA1_PORTR|nr:hypothetical protein [Portunus trituberculatus]
MKITEQFGTSSAQQYKRRTEASDERWPYWVKKAFMQCEIFWMEIPIPRHRWTYVVRLRTDLDITSLKHFTSSCRRFTLIKDFLYDSP